MAEFDAVGVAAVFAADAEFDFRPGASALLHCDFHKSADAGLVDAGEGVGFDDVQFLVSGQEGSGVITAHAKCGLGEVVSSEAEKLGVRGDFVCR